MQAERLSIRGRLEVLAAASYVCAAAARAHNAECDVEVALVAQRVIGDGITVEIERIDVLTHQGEKS